MIMRKIASIILLAAVGCGLAFAQAPAFPGAEGFGRYTTGGRGGEVRHVTNLNDSGKGSFREAVKGTNKKIVVFDVAGEIALESTIVIGANTTIAGQTAPGEGITLRYHTVRPNGDNIIMRFIRVRRGEERDVNDGADAVWARHFKNVILDHCSFSWSIDEVASFYDNREFTMQWCTVGEALNNAGHDKGAHGYGGIWGGKNASFHHNMIVHVNNRAPRFNGARYEWDGYDKSTYPNTVQAERVDFRNCVVYNWGSGGCYGGPGGGYINMVNNYYKAGPGTSASKTTRLTQVSVNSSGNSTTTELDGYCSRYYINGNYMYAAPEGEQENYDWKGVAYDKGLTDINGLKYMADPYGHYGAKEAIDYDGGKYVSVRIDAPIASGKVTTHNAEAAFARVVEYAGASLAKDMVDARYEEEALTGTATYIGSVTGVEGQIDVVADQGEYVVGSESRPANFDTDGDGIPNEWESANGLNPNSSSDASKYTIDSKGYYTNIEVYINSLVEDLVKAQNEGAVDGVDEYFPSYTSHSDVIVRNPSAEVVGFEYYNLDGRRLDAPVKGVNIRRTVFADGRVLTDKVVR